MKTIVKYRGIDEIEMEAIPRAEIKEDELICGRCPYKENCESFPDPREKLLGIKGVDFLDFCIELDENIVPAEGLIENCQHIPVAGSLEKLQ